MKDLLAKYHLPKKIEVSLHKSKEGGFVVEFNDLPGCFTQVKDLLGLREGVTDAILTYFDVPRAEANKLIYVPKTSIVSNAVIDRSPVLPQTQFDLFVAA